jgi:hyperosmotically inducible periplasmic protein
MTGLYRAGAMAYWLAAGLMTGCAAWDTGNGSNPRLAARLEYALARNAGDAARSVSVQTNDSQVQLSGFVDTPEQKREVERIARSTPGVRAVTNTIVVKTY